jgi:hypothetical protein
MDHSAQSQRAESPLLSPCATKAEGSRTVRKQGIFLFCVLMFCYAYVHQGLGANQNSRLDVLHALFVHKTVRIDDYQENTVDKSILDGHYYSDKAPGIVFLALPSFSASVGILKLFQIPLDSGAGWLASSWITTAGSVGVITALGGVAMFAFLCPLVGQRYALITSLVVFLGAAPFPYATMLFSHAAVMSLVCIALWAMADEEFWKRIAPGLPNSDGSSRREEAQARSANQSEPPHVGCYDISTKRYILAGLCCGLAISSEYTAATAAGGVLALAFLTSFRRGLVLALGAVPALLLIPLWNWVCFGSPLAFGYHHLAATAFQEMNHGLFGITFPPKADAAWLILFSPERGLFFWTPFFLVAFLGLKALLVKSPNLLWTAYFVVVAHVVAISGYYMPSGGWALGPRHLAPMLPFLAIPTAFGLTRYSHVGVFLGCSSLLLTGVATLITSLTPDEPAPLLLHYYSGRLITASFTHNLGSILGLPPYLAVSLFLVGILAAYLWAVRRRQRRNHDSPECLASGGRSVLPLTGG